MELAAYGNQDVYLDDSHYKKPLTIKQKRLFLKGVSYKNPCVICLDSCNTQVFCCNAHMHRKCLTKWLKRSKERCPHCRSTGIHGHKNKKKKQEK